MFNYMHCARERERERERETPGSAFTCITCTINFRCYTLGSFRFSRLQESQLSIEIINLSRIRPLIMHVVHDKSYESKRIFFFSAAKRFLIIPRRSTNSDFCPLPGKTLYARWKNRFVIPHARARTCAPESSELSSTRALARVTLSLDLFIQRCATAASEFRLRREKDRERKR